VAIPASAFAVAAASGAEKGRATTTALAIRGPSSSPECGGWQFWADADLLDTDKDAVTDVSQRVRVRTTDV
jgi:hypothetical protein